MGILEKIEQSLLSVEKEIKGIQEKVSRIEGAMVGNKPYQVFITTTEAARLLKISSPTVASFEQCGLLKAYYSSGSKFLLSEVDWLMGQTYKNIRSEALEKLVEAKKKRFDQA